MQTFLPYADYRASARCLDYRRLGKQRVEAKQIINILEGKESRWKNHPAVRMWKGYVQELKAYYNEICWEWERRGYKHNMGYYSLRACCEPMPFWYFDEAFHSSHRAALLYKNYEHYSQYGWEETPKIDYVWPC